MKYNRASDKKHSDYIFSCLICHKEIVYPCYEVLRGDIKATFLRKICRFCEKSMIFFNKNLDIEKVFPQNLEKAHCGCFDINEGRVPWRKNPKVLLVPY